MKEGLARVLPSRGLIDVIEKVSLAGGGLGHLPARGQGHVVRNLIRRLTEMLWGGTC